MKNKLIFQEGSPLPGLFWLAILLAGHIGAFRCRYAVSKIYGCNRKCKGQGK